MAIAVVFSPVVRVVGRTLYVHGTKRMNANDTVLALPLISKL